MKVVEKERRQSRRGGLKVHGEEGPVVPPDRWHMRANLNKVAEVAASIGKRRRNKYETHWALGPWS